MEVLGVTSYGDLSQFAQQQSRARRRSSCRSTTRSSRPGPSSTPPSSTCASSSTRSGSRTPRSRSTSTARRARPSHIPNDVLRELHGFIHMFEDTPEFVARHIIRETKSLPRLAGAAVLPRAGRLRAGRLVLVALPGALGRRRVPEEPGRADVPPVLRREHAARRRLQRGRRAGPAARPHGPGRRGRAQRRAHLQCRPLLLRHQRHVDVEQDGVARERRARRHRRRRPQLPRVDPARDHDDRRDPRVPAADAQSPGHHRPDSARRIQAGEHPEADRGEPVRARGEEQEAADPDAHAEHVRRHRLQRRDAEADAAATASRRCTSTRRGCRTRRSTISTATCTRSARTARAARTR